MKAKMKKLPIEREVKFAQAETDSQGLLTVTQYWPASAGLTFRTV